MQCQCAVRQTSQCQLLGARRATRWSGECYNCEVRNRGAVPTMELSSTAKARDSSVQY